MCSIPLSAASYVALFWRARHAIWAEATASKALEFLVGDYDRTYFFWELVEVLKKLLLVGAVGRAAGTLNQLVIAFVLVTCFRERCLSLGLSSVWQTT